MPLLNRLLLLFLLGIVNLMPAVSLAQSVEQQQASRDYFMASQMMRQDRYDDALSLLLPLARRFPQNFSYFDKTLECYIQLKQYDEALSLIEERERLGLPSFEYNIKRGYLFHLQGDTLKARSLWDQMLAQRPTQLQFYRSMGETLSDRREYPRVILAYTTARQLFGDDTIFLFEMAQVLRVSGNFQGAVNEYLTYLKRFPDKLSLIQRQFNQFSDEPLLDMAIVEIEEQTRGITTPAAWFVPMRELLLWLYVERKQIRRAFATARDLEMRGVSSTPYQFNLARSLREQHEFEYAASAFQFYHTHPKAVSYLKAQSLDETAITYMQWRTFAQKNNLENLAFRDSLAHLAQEAWTSILNTFPEYEYTDRVISSLAQLHLDVFFNAQKAAEITDRLQRKPASERSELIKDYLLGRIALFNKEYNEARRFFTRANKAARIGEWADLTRYHLILTDFFTGDFEFAKIQMKALEKQHTSLMVNDVLRMRTYLQDGMVEDSASQQLHALSKGLELLKHGKLEEAISTLQASIQEDVSHPLADDMILVLNEHLISDNPSLVFSLTSGFLSSKVGANSKHRERLLWDKARTAERYWMMYRNGTLPSNAATHSVSQAFFQQTSFLDTILIQPDKLMELYEQLMLEFPQGFYPDYARAAILRLERQIETS